MYRQVKVLLKTLNVLLRRHSRRLQPRKILKVYHKSNFFFCSTRRKGKVLAAQNQSISIGYHRRIVYTVPHNA